MLETSVQVPGAVRHPTYADARATGLRGLAAWLLSTRTMAYPFPGMREFLAGKAVSMGHGVLALGPVRPVVEDMRMEAAVMLARHRHLRARCPCHGPRTLW